MSKATLYGCLMLASLPLSACRETCTTEEIRQGDECVLRPDAGTMEDTSGSRSGVSADDIDGAEGPSGPDDAGSDDSVNEEGGSGAPGDTSGPCTADGGVADECKLDPCNPNPCGHGKCSTTADGFSCRCEAGWIGEGTCDTNTNATLKDIVLSEGTLFPAFDPSVYDYSVDVGIGTPEITLTPIASVPDGVEFRLDGKPLGSSDASGPHSLELNVPKRMKIEVIASNGTMTTYAITMRRSLALQAEIVCPRPEAITFGTVSQNSLHRGKGIALNDGLLAAVIEGPAERQGTVALYNRAADGTWTWLDYVGSPREQRGLYGAAIALTADWLAVGAPGIAARPPETPGIQGGLYLFQRNLLPDRAEQIYIPSPAGAEEFGHSLALHDDTLAVLSDRHLHIFQLRNAVWTAASQHDVRGYSVATTGDRIAVSENEDAVRIYRRVGDGWRDDGYISDTGGRSLGGVVTASQQGFAVTTPYACFGGCTGLAPLLRLYEPLDDSWSSASIGPPFGAAVPRALDPNGFGLDLGWAGPLAVVGAPLEGSLRGGVHTLPGTLEGIDLESEKFGLGVAYFFVKASMGWRIDAIAGPKIHANAMQQMVGFGMSIAIDQGTIAIAAPSNAAGSAGAIYILGPDCNGVRAKGSLPGC